MALICTYCAAQGTPRDEENGRCGSCSLFYTGNEVVVEDAPSIASVENEVIEPSVPSSESQPPEKDASAEDASPVEADEPSSEDLVKPRRLSPHFKRRVEMAWQPSFANGDVTAECTISRGSYEDDPPLSSGTFNSGGSASDTKSTLSIATRRIASVNEKDGGDYELNEVIGEGSMGKVWSARQASLDRDVAVKVPRAELANAGSIGEGQFISEVVVTGKLEHPNIVPIYELGRDTEGVPFYSMKHVQGLAWNESITEKSLSENLEILMKVCDAIAFAHDKNFLHRDIKPHNVMVGEFGEVSVMDWGIAVSISEDPNQPWAAMATGPAGTPAYMAPEMAIHNSSELGVVSDVYLLGAVLYEIVTGYPPHPRTGEAQAALFAAAANEIVPTDRTGELIDIARRAMATNVMDRYQGVPALQDALREYQSHRESIALSESASDHLATAKERKSSDEFARARFGFEEALKLWPGNAKAVSGLRVATLDYARNALQQENYELGISILDPGESSHRDLLNKLEVKRRGRRRLATFSKVAGATAIAAVLAVVFITTSKNRELDLEREEAVAARNDALSARNEAVDAQGKAVTEAQRARTAEQRARSARDTAVLAKFEARSAEGAARHEKRNAEVASYASDIGLAAESIRRNAFNKATAILAGLAPHAGADDSTEAGESLRAKLRHLEWGLLQDASTPGPVEDLLLGQRIEAVASSEDGRVIAAATEDGSVSLWQNTVDGHPNDKMTVLRYGEKLHSIALSNDGRFLAAAGVVRRENVLAMLGASKQRTLSNDRFAIQIWDTSKNTIQTPDFVLVGHTAEVLSVTFSADSKRVLSSGADRTAILWDRETGRELAIARDHLDRRVWNARFSPDESQIVTACDDGRVRVWDLSQSGSKFRKTHDFRGHEGPVYAAVFSGDGRSVISGGYDRRLLRWRLPDQSMNSKRSAIDLESHLNGGAADRVSFTQIGHDYQQHEASIHAITTGRVGNQEYVLTCGNDNTIRVWNPASDEWHLDKVLRGHGRWVRGCTFSQSGEAIFSGAHDGAKWWQWRNYSMPRELFPIAERRFGKEPSELGLSAASQTIYSRDGRWVATAYDNGTVAVWDLETGTRSASQLLVDGHALLTATGVFYQGGRKLLTSAGDNTTRLWDVSRGTQTQKLRGTGWRGAADVIAKPDGTTLVISGSDDPLTPAWLWRIADGQSQREPLLADVVNEYLAKQLDAGKLDASSVENRESQRAEATSRLKRQVPDVTTVQISRDGERFVIGDSSGRCFLFELNNDHSSRFVTQLSAHGSAIRSAVFLPGGQSLVTASVDGQVKQWSATDGTLIQTLPWAGPVTSLAISSDGSLLLVGHAPSEIEDSPIVRLFNLGGDEASLLSQLSHTDSSGTRQWKNNFPSVQSVQFSDRNDRAMVSLYFPTKKDGTGNAAVDAQARGYRMGWWDWKQTENDFQPLRTRMKGEIAAAVLDQSTEQERLLVVGGKGARLWTRSTAGSSYFDQLASSFRPSSSLSTVDFSFDDDSKQSRRLVVGDREGNLRVWELDQSLWSEKVGSATQLSGHHRDQVVASRFDPTNPDRMVTADRSGKVKIWEYESRWITKQKSLAKTETGKLNCVSFSPDGQRLFLGGENGAELWQRMDEKFLHNDAFAGNSSVFAATFSNDGAWIATSDHENSVAFWDVRGNVIARMQTEDAKGIATMAISADRRRFVTGHDDKRVVIWDTSQLVDTMPSLRDPNVSPIKELLTLEEHRRGVTSIAISPNGRNLLTAGEEGRTIIWSGEAITPVSISNSRTQVIYRPEDGFVTLDNAAVVADPSLLADFSNATVHVSIENQSKEERVAILSQPLPGGGSVDTVARADGSVSVRYLRFRDSQPVVIGQIVSSAEDKSELKIRLNKNADAGSVQYLMRSLAYNIETSAAESDSELYVTSVSSADNQGQDLMGASREIAIEVRGISYHDQDDSSATEYPTQLETVITVEVQARGVRSPEPIEPSGTPLQA